VSTAVTNVVYSDNGLAMFKTSALQNQFSVAVNSLFQCKFLIV